MKEPEQWKWRADITDGETDELKGIMCVGFFKKETVCFRDVGIK